MIGIRHVYSTNLHGKHYDFSSPYASLMYIHHLNNCLQNLKWTAKSKRWWFGLSMNELQVFRCYLMPNDKFSQTSFLIGIKLGSLLCTLHILLSTFQYTMHFLNHLIQTLYFGVEVARDNGIQQSLPYKAYHGVITMLPWSCSL